MANINLSSDAAAKFDLVKWPHGPVVNMGSHGVIDIRNITLKKAEALYKAGCPYFVEKGKTAKVDKADKK